MSLTHLLVEAKEGRAQAVALRLEGVGEGFVFLKLFLGGETVVGAFD